MNVRELREALADYGDELPVVIITLAEEITEIQVCPFTDARDGTRGVSIGD